MSHIVDKSDGPVDYEPGDDEALFPTCDHQEGNQHLFKLAQAMPANPLFYECARCGRSIGEELAALTRARANIAGALADSIVTFTERAAEEIDRLLGRTR